MFMAEYIYRNAMQASSRYENNVIKDWLIDDSTIWNRECEN